MSILLASFMRPRAALSLVLFLTLATMLVLVLPARAGARVLHAPWLDRYGDAAAGGVIVIVGVLVVTTVLSLLKNRSDARKAAAVESPETEDVR